VSGRKKNLCFLRFYNQFYEFQAPVKTFVEFYLNEVNKLEFESEPSYDKIQAKLNDCLEWLGHKEGDNFRLFENDEMDWEYS